MAKIGELLGLGNNSIYKTFADNRNLFSGAFGGMAANPMNPWGGFAQGAQLGGQIDTIEAERVKQEAEEAAAKNSTLEWLRSQGYDDLVAGVEGGGLDMSTAWGEGLARSRPQVGPEMTANQNDYQFYANQELTAGRAPMPFAEWVNGGGASSAPTIVETFDPTTGQPVKGYMDGTNFVPVGGPRAPNQGGGWNATTQKELFEAEDAVAAGGYVLSALDTAINLNKTAADGAFAGQRATIGANIPDIGIFNSDQTDQATIQYQNIVNELALNQLKTIFGAAPTEGERKILLEIQGSVEQPRAVRESILRRAKEMAERRLAEAQRKAAGLRSGEYFDPGYGQQPQPMGGVDDLLVKYQ